MAHAPIRDDLPLVGRRTELAALLNVIAAVEAGRTAAVVLEGEAGIGKSRLVREALATTVKARILAGRGDELDRDRPFAMVAGALGATPASPDRAARRLAELADTVGVGGGRVVAAALSLLESQALAAPTVLGFEDVHWADHGSLLFLRAAAELEDLPLGLIVTARTGPRPAEVDSVIDGLLDRGASRVRLEPLSDAESRELARVAAQPTFDEVLASAVSAAAGNPFYVIELARASLEGPDAPLPVDLRHAALRSVRSLAPATRDVLTVASLFGSSLSVSDLAAVTSRPAAQLLPHLREALDAGVLVESGEEIMFRHDLLRTALSESVSASVRKALHRDVARALAHSGVAPERVATHFAASAEPGDAEAVEWMERAANDVSSRDVRVAIDVLQRAISLCRDMEGTRGRLEARLVDLLSFAGRAGEAIATAETALARRPEPDVAVRLFYSYVAALVWAGDLGAVRAVAARARDSFVGEPKRAFFEMMSHWGFGPDAVTAARHARALAEARADSVLRMWTFTLEAMTETLAGRLFDAKRLFHLAIDASREADDDAAPRLRLAALGTLSLVLSGLGDADAARSIRRELQRDAEDMGATALVVNTLMLDGRDALDTGRLAEARAYYEAVLSAADRGISYTSAMLDLARVDLLTGRRNDFELRCEAVAGDPEIVADLAILRGLALHADRSWAEAVKAFSSAWFAADTGRPWPHVISPACVRAAHEAGEGDLAAGVAAAARAEVDRGGAAELAPVADWCEGIVADDAQRILTAADALRRLDRPIASAAALEDAAAAHLARGQSAAAKAALQEALELYGDLEIPPGAARVAEQLRSLGVRPGARGRRGRPTEGWDSLTPAERQVVELVAEGLTNPEIAARLYVSRHTVVSHLKHVYAKLGIASRVDLAAEHVRRSA